MEIDRLNSAKSIFDAFKQFSEINPEKELLKYRTSNGIISLKRSEVLKYVASIAKTLRENGVTEGSKVAIISNTRFEWIISDLAILSLGAVSVSVYQSLLASDIGYILFDSEVTHLFVENKEQLGKIKELTEKEWEITENEDRPSACKKFKFDLIISFEEVEDDSLGAISFKDLIISVDNSTSDNFNFPEIAREHLGSLVYTSGTTGPPKGVIQTHDNHLSNVRQVVESGLMIKGGSIFLFLPLAHSFARLMAYISTLTDITLVLPEVTDKKSSKLNPVSLLRDMSESNCEIIPIVPRFLEKIKDQLETKASKKSLEGLLLKLALSKYGFLVFFIKGKIKNKIFGSNFKYAVSGGAKLNPSVNKFFNNLGILILEGYGLTETVVATNACTPKFNKIGSVGKTLAKDIQIKILEDGEIVYKGPNISKGYFNRPTATKKSYTEDGWFLTGDVGRIDEDGFLFVEGRKKEIIVTSGGKKIAPLPIEEKINNSPYISQSVLFGDGMKYVVALVTLNKEIVKEKLSISDHELTKPNECAQLVELLQEHITKVNSELSSFETIKKIFIAPEDLTVENSLLTPSMKIKRKEVERVF